MLEGWDNNPIIHCMNPGECVFCTCLPADGTGTKDEAPGFFRFIRTFLSNPSPAPPHNVTRLLAKRVSQTFHPLVTMEARLAGRHLEEIQRESYFVDLDFINIIIISPTLSCYTVQRRPQFCQEPWMAMQGSLGQSSQQKRIFLERRVPHVATCVMCVWGRVAHASVRWLSNLSSLLPESVSIFPPNKVSDCVSARFKQRRTLV